MLAGSLPAAFALFLFLESRETLELTFELESDLASVAFGQLFWAEEGQPFREAQSAGFDLRPGRAEYRARVPIGVRALRLDPGQTTGTLRLVRLSISDGVHALARWGDDRGFDGWGAQGDLLPPREVAGLLELRTTGIDPILVTTRPFDLAAIRRPRSVALALAAAVALATVQLVLLGSGARSPRPASAPADSAGVAPGAPSAPAAPSAGRAKAALALVSTLVAVGLGALAWRVFEGWRTPAAPVASAGYDLSMVDTLGRRVSARVGNLRLQLDPFTLYRNQPDQRGGRFATGAHGFRLPFDARDSRPRVMVLGGSMAFGYGLERDEDVFSAVLGRLDPGRQYVNAAVIGFLSGQELSLMLHQGDRLDARAYLVVDGWNELYVQLFPGFDGSQYGYNRRVLRDLEERLEVAMRVDGDLGDEPASADPPPSPIDTARILDEYVRNLGRMSDLARARGAELLIAFQPFLGSKRELTPGEQKIWSEWRTAYPRSHDRFREQYAELVAGATAFCVERGIECVDLARDERFLASDVELYSDTVHLNAEGHRRLAESLLESLRRRPESEAPPTAR